MSSSDDDSSPPLKPKRPPSPDEAFSVFSPTTIEEGFDDEHDGDTPRHSVDELVEKVGNGWFQLRVFFSCGFVYGVDAMEVVLLTFIRRPAQKEFGATDTVGSLIASFVFLGMLIGALTMGWFSDHYGRKKCLMLSTATCLLGGILSGMSPSIEWLIFARMIVGVGVGGFHSATVIFLEFIPRKNSGLVMSMYCTFWTWGILFQCVVADLLQDYSWRTLIYVSTAPLIASLGVTIFIPESPRWLAQQPGAMDEVKDVILQIARVNNTTNKLPKEFIVKAPPRPPKSEGQLENYKKLFQGENLKLTLVLMVAWTAAALNYYGVLIMTEGVFYGTSVGPYLASLITAIGEFPSYAAQVVYSQTVGRRAGMYMTCVGIVFMLAVFRFTYDSGGSHFDLAVSLIAMFVVRGLAQCFFNILWVFTPEAYATDVRTSGMGLCSAVARIGGFVAPFVGVPLAEYSLWGATFVFMLFGCLAGVATYNLPFDTTFRELAAS